MTFEAGQECEMLWRDEGDETWCRVRIVSDDGATVWVRHTDRIGNSFPVPRKYLRLVSKLKQR